MEQQAFEPIAVRKQQLSKEVPAPLPTSQPVQLRGQKIAKRQQADKAPMKTPVTVASNPISETSLAPIVKMTHSVQVGAYRNKSYANNQIDLLKEKGYPARIVTVTDWAGESWHTVRIGDFPTWETAHRYAMEFSIREKLEAAVRPYGKL